MPKLRYQPPDRLPGASHFSAREDLCGSLNAVKLVKSQAWASDDLRDACELEVKYARKRLKGRWELAAVAFVASHQVDVKPWYDETTEELWRECGFKSKPSRQTVHRRLRELETVCVEFLKATGIVIQRCREHDPRVMAHTHFDFTEDETHAALIHDCQPGDACVRTGRSTHKTGGRAARAKTLEAREHREQLNTESPDESAKQEEGCAPEKTCLVTRNGRKYRRIRMKSGCWYITRDLSAGVRAYTSNGKTQRFWHGYYNGKAICHYTGGVIPSVDAADRQEYDLFPGLYDSVCEAVGEAPETAVADRGMSVASCFEHVTKNGTAPVFPWRASGGNKRHDKETHDRHGVMRCKHCGGPMSQVKFSANGGKPRLWFRCMVGGTVDCAKDQTISCSTDWRSLIPLARTEPLYCELKESHQTYEAVHDYWRDRYKVAADDLGVRPKAVGLEFHRLRAYVACYIDWLRIAAKNDWLDSPAESACAASPGAIRKTGERKFKTTGERIAKSLADKRVRMGLAQPYGPKAAKLGLGDATLPSERAASKPKKVLALDLPGP